MVVECGECNRCPLAAFCGGGSMGFWNRVEAFSRRSRKAPYTWGQEIETDDENRDVRSRLNELSVPNWWDGSGPLEFAMPPLSYNKFWPYSLYKAFISDSVLKNIPKPYEGREMGSHLHLAAPEPRSREVDVGVLNAWGRLLLSVVYHAQFLWAFLVSYKDDGYHIKFRDCYRWISSRDSMVTQFLGYMANGENRSAYDTLRMVSGRVYGILTFNRHNKSRLTIEIRLNEAVGIKPFVFSYIVSKLAEKGIFAIPTYYIRDVNKESLNRSHLFGVATKTYRKMVRTMAERVANRASMPPSKWLLYTKFTVVSVDNDFNVKFLGSGNYMDVINKVIDPLMIEASSGSVYERLAATTYFEYLRPRFDGKKTFPLRKFRDDTKIIKMVGDYTFTGVQAPRGGRMVLPVHILR